MMKVFAVPVVLLCLACLLRKPSHGAAVLDGLKPIDSTLQQVIDQQQLQPPLEMISIHDLSYRLDLVDCPQAEPVAQSVATYPTRLFYSKSISNFECVVRSNRVEMMQLQLNEDNRAFVSQQYTQGIVQRIMYSCPNNQRGEVESLSIDLPYPKLLGTDEVCVDSLLFSQDGSSDVTCQLCGTDFPSSPMGRGRNTDSTCWNLFFTDNLVVTFRSSNQDLEGQSFMGFNLTINCILNPTEAPPTCYSPLELQQEKGFDPPQCLMEDPKLTTKEYFANQDPIAEEDFEKYFKKLLETGKTSVIPIDAQDVLQSFYDEFAISSVVVKDFHRILHLALLSERSCDESLSTFATRIVHLVNSK